MNTPGPATSVATSVLVLRQNEQAASTTLVSPMPGLRLSGSTLHRQVAPDTPPSAGRARDEGWMPAAQAEAGSARLLSATGGRPPARSPRHFGVGPGAISGSPACPHGRSEQEAGRVGEGEQRPRPDAEHHG